MYSCRELSAWTVLGPPWIRRIMRADREAAFCRMFPLRRRKGGSGTDRIGGRGGSAPRMVLASGGGDSGSVNPRFALDSQNVQSLDCSQALWIGPLPGDIAEIEAYCRIFRAAELLHSAVMKTVCNPESGECIVSYDFPSDYLPLLEEKVVTMLGCMQALVDRGRDDILHGRSSLINSFRVPDPGFLGGRSPPLASFRSEMKRCCENLHVALARYLKFSDDRSMKIWQKLQRLRNVSYDVGLPRSEEHPCPAVFANWAPVCSAMKKDGMLVEDSDIAFWKGGQVTNEGLDWLIEKGFKTIVDLREEVSMDEYYGTAIELAISNKMIDVVRLPVEHGTAPSSDQVKQFSMLVSDPCRGPFYVHSQEGVNRTSAMVSRWRQHNAHFLRSHPSTKTFTFNGVPRKSEDHNQATIQSFYPLQQDIRPINGSGLITETNNESDVEINSSFQNGYLSDEYQNEASDRVNGRVDKEHFLSLSEKIDPFRAQFPSGNIFSQKDMKRFFRGSKVSPKRFVAYQEKNIKAWPAPIKQQVTRNVDGKSTTDLSVTIHPSLQPTGARVIDSVHSPNSSIDTMDFLDGTPMPHCLNDLSKEGEQKSAGPLRATDDVNTKAKVITTSPDINFKKPFNVSTNLAGENSEIIDGNMCSSATGVVRLQSRKKAEMFLVRTDGVSCTREKVTESSLAFSHPSTQQQLLMWKSVPKTVLLLKKLGEELMDEAKEVAAFLYYQENMNVIVEPDVHDAFDSIPGFGFVQTFQDTSDLQERVDLVACLGGDGVILHGSNLFRGAVPPMVSFNLGSLGFLTSHCFEDYRHDLHAIIHGNTGGVYITLRMRLHCEILRNGKKMPGKVFDVLNEVVVDRGSSPYISKIECYEHNHLITKVQGDGVIIATPTGSTAYSTAAGGSMVHPNVPCLLFTPICPHSLSFRPVILPDSAELELKIPDSARSNAWVSFDGKRRQQLSRGDSVRISMSQRPLPTVNKSDQTGDWFQSLIRCLNWNERLDQKAL